MLIISGFASSIQLERIFAAGEQQFLNMLAAVRVGVPLRKVTRDLQSIWFRAWLGCLSLVR